MDGSRTSRATARNASVAREMATDDMPGTEVATWLRVSAGRVSQWTSDIVQQKQRRKDATIWWLHCLGWAQEEIGAAVGLERRSVGDRTAESLTTKLSTTVQDQAKRGKTPEPAWLIHREGDVIPDFPDGIASMVH